MQSASPDSAGYLLLADKIETNLRRHVLEPWFPRAVDSKRGGFHQNYGEDWTPDSPGWRSLVYQSRLTWVASKASIRYRDQNAKWIPTAMHGLKFLRDAMWDDGFGGLFWALDPQSNPMASKHVYGMAFAIYAASACYQATHHPDAIDLAHRTFDWLELYAHDRLNGGYYEALHPDGKPIRDIDDTPDTTGFGLKPGLDAVGTAYGLKSMNTHIHLMEAFAEYQSVRPDENVAKRLKEVFEIIRDLAVRPDGYLNQCFTPTWEIVTDDDSYGHDIETAFLLLEAADVLGIPDDERTWHLAKSLVDHTLDVGWDSQFGGVYYSGDPVSGPTSLTEAAKGWWEQAEGLNALLLMHERFGAETPRYWQPFLQQWEFIDRFQVDHVHQGWYWNVSREGIPKPGARKSDGWTDPYHQARALMNVSDRLRRLARG